MNATVTWTGTEVIAVGGQPAIGQSRLYADGIAYSPATNRWRRLPAIPAGRIGHAAVWTGHQLLIWGGMPVGDTGAVSAFVDGAAYTP